MLEADLRLPSVPQALVYLIDAHASQAAIADLLTNILEHHLDARLVVVAKKFTASESRNLLSLGAKGLLTYAEARDQLPRALLLVASGGFWVPRAILSTFVDSILTDTHGRHLKVEGSMDLSGRQHQVLDALLENLANKEIGSKLNISERTAKFHVSNLLSKFGVRRRADLILLCYQSRELMVGSIGIQASPT